MILTAVYIYCCLTMPDPQFNLFAGIIAMIFDLMCCGAIGGRL